MIYLSSIISVLLVRIPYYNRNLTFPDLSVNVKSYSTDSSVIPVKNYENADLDRLQILKENKGKSGVYRWTNLTNGKSYIGSSVNLERRLKEYFSIYYLEWGIKKSKSLINISLIKYGYSNFSLEILEYCKLYETI